MTDIVPNLNVKQDLQRERVDGGPGPLLADARKRAGRSVEDLAKALYVAPRVIDCIERNDFENLPPSIFVRGYLRTFAKEVGVKQEEVLAQHSRLTGDDGINPREPLRNINPAHTHALPQWFPLVVWLVSAIVVISLISIAGSLWGNSVIDGLKSVFENDPTTLSGSPNSLNPVVQEDALLLPRSVVEPSETIPPIENDTE